MNCSISHFNFQTIISLSLIWIVSTILMSQKQLWLSKRFTFNVNIKVLKISVNLIYECSLCKSILIILIKLHNQIFEFNLFNSNELLNCLTFPFSLLFEAFRVCICFDDFKPQVPQSHWSSFIIFWVIIEYNQNK